MVIHWRKVKDTANHMEFKNTNDRGMPRLLSATKSRTPSGRHVWFLSYFTGNRLLRMGAYNVTDLGSVKTKREAVEKLRKYMKSNP